MVSILSLRVALFITKHGLCTVNTRLLLIIVVKTVNFITTNTYKIR